MSDEALTSFTITDAYR